MRQLIREMRESLAPETAFIDLFTEVRARGVSTESGQELLTAE
jgi:hypothetical protein